MAETSFKVENFTINNLILRPDSGRLAYRENQNENRRGIYWGRRKLVMYEIEFLTLYWDKTKIPNLRCVYAGAAPGFHLPLLLKLFPGVRFICYDTRELEVDLVEYKNQIEFRKRYFNDDEAAQFANQNDVFFISDIRALTLKHINPEKARTREEKQMTRVQGEVEMYKNQGKIKSDLADQMSWVKIMNPVVACLKFAPPWLLNRQSRDYLYLKGTCYLQPYTGATTTETRLVCKRNQNNIWEEANWDLGEYEDWMYYHNYVERSISYVNMVTGMVDPLDPPNLDNDWDSVCEITILKLYFDKIGIKTDFKAKIINLSNYITDVINRTAIVTTDTSGVKRREFKTKSSRLFADRRREEKEFMTRNIRNKPTVGFTTAVTPSVPSSSSSSSTAVPGVVRPRERLGAILPPTSTIVGPAPVINAEALAQFYAIKNPVVGPVVTPVLPSSGVQGSVPYTPPAPPVPPVMTQQPQQQSQPQFNYPDQPQLQPQQPTGPAPVLTLPSGVGQAYAHVPVAPSPSQILRQPAGQQIPIQMSPSRQPVQYQQQPIQPTQTQPPISTPQQSPQRQPVQYQQPTQPQYQAQPTQPQYPPQQPVQPTQPQYPPQQQYQIQPSPQRQPVSQQYQQYQAQQPIGLAPPSPQRQPVSQQYQQYPVQNQVQQQVYAQTQQQYLPQQYPPQQPQYQVQPTQQVYVQQPQPQQYPPQQYQVQPQQRYGYQ